MHEEPCSLRKTTSRIDAGDSPPEPVSLLEDLDQILSRRADAIEAEFREIAQVRERIRQQLLAAGGDVAASPGAEILGQVWGK